MQMSNSRVGSKLKQSGFGSSVGLESELGMLKGSGRGAGDGMYRAAILRLGGNAVTFVKLDDR